MRQWMHFLAIGTIAAAFAGCQADRGQPAKNANGSADEAQTAAAQMSPESTNDANDDLQSGAASTQPSKSPDIRELNRFD